MTVATPTDRQSVPVRKATGTDLASLSQTLAEAFFSDPVFQWWIPDGNRREHILPEFFGAVAEATFPAEELYTTDDGVGAAVWLPPGGQLVEDDMVALAPELERATEEYAETLFEFLALMDERHPLDPHYYLFLLGTRPEWQSKGIGSALLKVVLDRCDRDETPAYLEASSEGNRRLYLRHGFEVTGEIHLRDAPPLWCMWRPPNPSR
jgi:GNAT superfamily N-acetyltransferase